MLRVLVSGCLAGAAIRFNETGVLVDSPIWRQREAEGRLVSFCPELAVGFPVPRPPAKIVDGTAAEVFDGHHRVSEARHTYPDLPRSARYAALHSAWCGQCTIMPMMGRTAMGQRVGLASVRPPVIGI